MTAEQSWNQLKSRYLREIETVLAHVDPVARRRILLDVEAHLDQRLNELVDDQKTLERFGEIIKDMGPAEEYAQLLSDETPVRPQTQKAKWFVIVLAVMLLLIVGVFSAPTVKTFMETRRMTAEQLSHKAWQLWRSGQYNQAEKHFKLALAKDDQLAPAWNGLGWSQFHLGKFDRAQEALDKCVEINDQFSGAWNGLGHIALAQADTDRAVQCWKKAIAIAPDATSSLSALAQLYMDRQQYDAAIEIYEKWLAVDPDEPTARAGLDKARKSKNSNPQ